MKQKLIITLDEEATEKYLEIARRKTTAEVDEDCVPSGVDISISIGPVPFGSSAYMGSEEIGEVTTELVGC